MLKRMEWNRSLSATLAAMSVGAALALGAVGANAENKDSDGVAVTHCDKKGTVLEQGWCPDTGNKHEAQQAERRRTREVETPTDGEPASPEIDR